MILSSIALGMFFNQTHVKERRRFGTAAILSCV